MKQIPMILLASNSEAFPTGSQVWGQEAYGQLTSLAGYDVEDVTYFPAAQRVDVRAVLGYHFTISTADYDRLVTEWQPHPAHPIAWRSRRSGTLLSPEEEL